MKSDDLYKFLPMKQNRRINHHRMKQDLMTESTMRKTTLKGQWGRGLMDITELAYGLIVSLRTYFKDQASTYIGDLQNIVWSRWINTLQLHKDHFILPLENQRKTAERDKIKSTLKRRTISSGEMHSEPSSSVISGFSILDPKIKVEQRSFFPLYSIHSSPPDG